MTRGIRGEKLFLEKRDYEAFLDILAETAPLWNTGIAAYCLVPNRYHLLIQTERDSLSKCMSYIKGRYTGVFNMLHQSRGPLFQRGYRSIPLEEDSYLLDLMRYIHRIPLLEGMASKLDAYEWSSHRAYMTETVRLNWICKDFLLSMLADDQRKQQKLYRQLVL
jgi:putative transposase